MVNTNSNNCHKEGEKADQEQEERLSVPSTNTVVDNHAVHIKVSDADTAGVAVLSPFALVYLTSVTNLFLFAGAHEA